MTRRKKRRNLSIAAQEARANAAISQGISNMPVFEATVGPKTPPHEGVPFDAINEALKNTDSCYIQFYRRNDKGQLANIVNRMFDVKDLLTVEDFCRQEWGGGRYYIRTFHPDNRTQLLLPAFHITLEGLSKPINKRGNVQGMDASGNFVVQTSAGPVAVTPEQAVSMGVVTASPQGGYQPLSPVTQGEPMTIPNPGFMGNQVGWMAGVNPLIQAAHTPAPGATMASDQVLNTVRAQEAQAYAQREAEQAARLARMEEQLREAADALRESKEKQREREIQLMQERHMSEMAAMRDQMKMAMEVRNAPPVAEKKMDMEGIAKLVAASAPVLAAFITSGRESNVEAAKSQAQMQQTLLTMMANKPDSTAELVKMIGVIAPVVAPVLTKMVDQKSPEAQAMLFQNLAESTQTQLAMTAQFVQSMAQLQSQDGSPPWWLPMIENGMKGIGDIIATMSAMKKVQGTPAPRALPQQVPVQSRPIAATPPATTATAPGIYETLDTSQSVPPPAPQAQAEVVQAEEPSNGIGHKPSPEVATKFVMAALPDSMRRPEWEQIIFALHSEMPPVKVADMLMGLLAHLDRFGMLPAELQPIMENPEAGLLDLITKLPIYAYAPDYCKLVVAAVVRAIEENSAEDEDSDETADVEEPGTVEVMS